AQGTQEKWKQRMKVAEEMEDAKKTGLLNQQNHDSYELTETEAAMHSDFNQAIYICITAYSVVFCGVPEYADKNQEHPDTITPQGTRSTQTPSYHKDPGAPGRLHTTRTQEHSDAITPQVPRSTQTPLQHKPHAGTQEHQTPLD
ncbi:hypothetical protein STEG23_006946, partial [Scotinomys teguina]